MSRFKKHDEPNNEHCGLCEDNIWVRPGVYTLYHGKAHCDVDDRVISRTHTKYGAICVACWDENNEVVRSEEMK